MATLSAVPFSALPVTDDGYTLLNENGRVHRSSKKLSELVGARTSSFLDKEQYANDSATFLTHQSLDEYATMDWVEEQNYITGVDLTNYYTKSETSGANEISAALDGKEDKVFVAEYGVTTYADIKAAYDAGKQIICKYVENESQTKYLSLSQFVKPANIFIFAGWATNGESIYAHFSLNHDGIHTDYQVLSNSYYATNETSGRGELTNAFNTKQDKLTFAGTNNTITSINNSAIQGGGAGSSNSWKQLSEEHGSSGTLDGEDFCVYLGADNTAYNASNIIGHNNKALNSNIFGNSNTIDKNLASVSTLSAEQYIKTAFNPTTYNVESATVYIRNFVAGVGNSAEYAKNAYIFGNENNVICDSSADYLNEDNDGYTFIYGWQNSADRNYDMAIGYKSLASGGENIAIGVPFETITGYNNYDGGYFITGAITPVAKGYKNIVIRGNASGISNTAINSNLTGNYVTDSDINASVNNSLINSFVQANTIRDVERYGSTYPVTGSLINNTFKNSNVLLTAYNVYYNKFMNDYGVFVTSNNGFNFNNFWHNKTIELSGENINKNIFFNNERLHIESPDICRNFIMNMLPYYSTDKNSFTATKLFTDNFMVKTIIDTGDNTLSGDTTLSSVNENFMFNTRIDPRNVSAYRGWGTNSDSNTTLTRNFLVGSYVGKYVYGTVSFADNSDRNTGEMGKISNTIRIFNFGDNTINKAENSLVFGAKNGISAISNSFVFGSSNTVEKTHLNDNTDEYLNNIFLFGDDNKLINDNDSSYGAIVVRNKILGIRNYIKASDRINDNTIIGNDNSINYNVTVPTKSTVISNVFQPTNPNTATSLQSAAFATYRNYILGNCNRVSQCITDSLIVGEGNYIFDTTIRTATDTADYNAMYVLGVANLAYDGSNQLNIGYNNETSGHFAEAIGDGIIAK